MKKIDTHCHCRDGNQDYKASIGQVFGQAKSLGIVAIGDMPNKNPAVTSERQVDYYCWLAEKQGCSEGYYMYIGATPFEAQITDASRTARTHPKVLGIKYFTTGGGDITIATESGQRKFYSTLVRDDYEGIAASHCEYEGLFRMGLWDPEKPWTWNDARPKECETVSAEDQLQFAKEAGFEGTVYILHVTCPDTVDLIDSYRGELKIVCGVTPQHLLLTTEDMHGKAGLRYKVNTPIRDPYTVEGLRKKLIDGKIDFIESDHAPHTFEEKFLMGEKCLSGYTSYDIYPRLLETLPLWGLSEKEIEDLTYNNAKRIFKKIKE